MYLADISYEKRAHCLFYLHLIINQQDLLYDRYNETQNVVLVRTFTFLYLTLQQ